MNNGVYNYFEPMKGDLWLDHCDCGNLIWRISWFLATKIAELDEHRTGMVDDPRDGLQIKKWPLKNIGHWEKKKPSGQSTMNINDKSSVCTELA